MFEGRLEAAGRAAPLRRSARVFAALGDRTRLQVVSRLCAGGPASIARLTEGSGVTRQAVTKHLRVLTEAGLVRCSRRGRECVWEFEPRRLAEAKRQLDSIARQWDTALNRLKIFVERQG
jgi:DNA-binding transcriptional ArsR family regulator